MYGAISRCCIIRKHRSRFLLRSPQRIGGHLPFQRWKTKNKKNRTKIANVYVIFLLFLLQVFLFIFFASHRDSPSNSAECSHVKIMYYKQIIRAVSSKEKKKRESQKRRDCCSCFPRRASNQIPTWAVWLISKCNEKFQYGSSASTSVTCLSHFSRSTRWKSSSAAAAAGVDHIAHTYRREPPREREE